MRTFALLAVFVLSTAPVSARSIDVCSGNNYLAFVSRADDGNARVSILDLARPLTEDALRHIPTGDEAPRLHCAASHLVIGGERPLEVTLLGAGAVRVEELAPGELMPESLRALRVTCDAVGELSTSELLGSGRRDVGHDIGQWTRLRRTEDGQERNLVVTSVKPGAEPGSWHLRTVLEQRQSKRAHRELVLGELDCVAE